jgi:myo-inositol-1(or 4)-monophosphatase
MNDDLAVDLRFALGLAKRAGWIMKSRRGAQVKRKSDGTPVTADDKAINAIVVAEVARDRSYHRILGEEGSDGLDDDGRPVWVCDPIDGTWLHAAGVPGSVFSLALVIDGEPVVGVIYDPWTGRMFHATAGAGAYLNDVPLRVNTVAKLDGACLSLPGNKGPVVDAGLLVHSAIAAGADVVTVGSVVYDASLVACGFAAGHVYQYSSPWDMAAVTVLVREAGGHVTDLEGWPQRYDRQIRGAIVSSGALHDQLVSLVFTCTDPYRPGVRKGSPPAFVPIAQQAGGHV